MRTIRILGFIAATLATIAIVTPVYACPAHYVPCGGACCPSR
jgi:hypothetical protein